MVPPAGDVGEHEAPGAQAGERALGHERGHHRAHGGVERVAALAQHLRAGLGRHRVARGHDALHARQSIRSATGRKTLREEDVVGLGGCVAIGPAVERPTEKHAKYTPQQSRNLVQVPARHRRRRAPRGALDTLVTIRFWLYPFSAADGPEKRTCSALTIFLQRSGDGGARFCSRSWR